MLQNSFLGCVQIFPGALVRSLKDYVGGSHEQSDFQPASLVSSLQGIVSPKIHLDGQIAKFFRPLIFEFCNTIPPEADTRCTATHVRYGPILLKKSAVATHEVR